ncbi:HSF-type DNA-binding-domain-containing protein, partial [Dimargaris cristalligena]
MDREASGYSSDTKTIPPFAAKLYESMEKAEFANCIQWDPSGTMIHVTDCKEFTKNVLPVYFKTRMFNSFVRQLHIYGFTRKSDARKNRGDNMKNQCTFQHPYFQKGRRDLLPSIKRQPQ